MLNKDASQITYDFTILSKSRDDQYYKICFNVHSPVFIMLNPDKRMNKLIIYHSL